MENPNILLIVMDAVRTRNMSIYGYEKETNPNLRRILSNCTFYKNAFSSSYWTLPSYASTFTGTHVSRHGLEVDGDVLDNKFITMAEMLKAHGYRTIGLCPNPYISEFSGLHRGFDILYNPANESLRSRLYNLINKALLHRKSTGTENAAEKPLGQQQNFIDTELERPHAFDMFNRLRVSKRILWSLSGLFDKYAKDTNDLAFRLMNDTREEPFFFLIHYTETHTPYVLPNIFRKKFLTSPDKKPWEVNQDYFRYYSGEARMDESDFEVLRALYDAAISYLDTRIFEIYSFLERKGLLDDTMLIITSDHGDNFGEHGVLFHIFSLYDTLIKVPLIIKYPASLGLSGIENRVVQNTDLIPTIMDLLGLNNKRMLDQIQGNSLISSKIRNRDKSYAISELVKPFGPRMQSLREKLKKYDRQLISIRTESKKYISASDGNHEFYDLHEDPNETRNLISSSDPAIIELREKLKPWLIPFNDCCRKVQWKISHEKAAVLEPEIQERLRSLGYL